MRLCSFLFNLPNLYLLLPFIPKLTTIKNLFSFSCALFFFYSFCITPNSGSLSTVFPPKGTFMLIYSDGYFCMHVVCLFFENRLSFIHVRHVLLQTKWQLPKRKPERWAKHWTWQCRSSVPCKKPRMSNAKILSTFHPFPLIPFFPQGSLGRTLLYIYSYFPIYFLTNGVGSLSNSVIVLRTSRSADK